MNDSLATAVLQALAWQHTFAYAQVQADGIITICSSKMGELLALENSQIVGKTATAVFPELIGAEAEILAVRQQQKSFYRLTHVNQVQDDGSIRYLTMQVTAVAPDDLLLLVEDRTENGRLYQALEQVQNELSLLRQHYREDRP